MIGVVPQVRTELPTKEVFEIEEIKMVESAFTAIGVRVSWVENLMAPFLYTAIPGGVAGIGCGTRPG